MSRGLLFDVPESPLHPDLGPLCAELGLTRRLFTSQRKAMAALKREQPDYLAVDFFYGYGNNYAGANVSNLDVLLRSLQRFAPTACTLIFADRSELRHIDKLEALFPLHAVIPLPMDSSALRSQLQDAIDGTPE